MSETIRKTEARMIERDRRRQARERSQKLWRTLGFVAVGVLLALGLGLVIYGSQAGSGAPRLQLDREQVDFGDQHFNNPVRASFKITNTGDGALTLNVPKVATVVEGC